MQINLVPDLSLFAVMAIFIVNYFVVSRFFLRPINDVLEARETEARTAQETYERSLADFNRRTAEIEERFHATRRDASQLRERFRAEAGTHRAGDLRAFARRVQSEDGGDRGTVPCYPPRRIATSRAISG